MLLHWVWLSTLPGLSPRKAARLLDEIGAPLEIYNASPAQLSEVSGITAADIAALSDKTLKRASRVLDDSARLGQQLLTLHDAAYPELLRAIDDPPTILYCRGKLQSLSFRPAVAVVGPRRVSPYGYRVTKSLSYQLAQAGVTIVSGMAAGTDAAAHAAALEAGKPTIAVLGCGLDVCYPTENGALFNQIPKTGLLISEYPPGTPPLAANFPARNRIISGLCCAVLLPEAPRRSGSLITAACALDQGRDVFAVPGNIDVPSSVGANLLIQDGARLVTCADDILSELAPRYPELLQAEAQPAETLAAADDPYATGVTAPPLQPAEPTSELLQAAADGARPLAERLISLLSRGALHADTLIAAVPESAADVTAALTMLELEGQIVQHPGKIFARS